jgi:hypothetical protein
MHISSTWPAARRGAFHEVRLALLEVRTRRRLPLSGLSPWRTLVRSARSKGHTHGECAAHLQRPPLEETGEQLIRNA